MSDVGTFIPTTQRSDLKKNKNMRIKKRKNGSTHTHIRKAKMFIYIIAFSYHVGYSDEERGGGAGGAVWSDIDFYRLEVRNPKARGAEQN